MLYLIASILIVNKQEVVNILTNFWKFEESREELIGETAKLQQMVKYFWNASIAATVSSNII